MAQSDNFNGGRQPGWQDYILPFGGSVTVQNNALRIQSSTSPDPVNFGPARAASFRPDNVYSDFRVEVDILDWATFASPAAQAFGILARANNIGPASTTGYALTITTNGTLDLTIIQNEAPSGDLGMGGDAIAGLSPANDYRMVFTGTGAQLHGQLFNLSDLSTPVAELTATDATFDSGVNGLFAFHQVTGTTNGPADATFDNFAATVPEPGTGAALLACIAAVLRRRRRAQ